VNRRDNGRRTLKFVPGQLAHQLSKIICPAFTPLLENATAEGQGQRCAKAEFKSKKREILYRYDYASLTPPPKNLGGQQ
jgi:hypothetical protein